MSNTLTKPAPVSAFAILNYIKKCWLICCCSVSIIACKKEEPKASSPLSSNKAITSFAFAVENNPGTHLSSDVAGIIKADSITVTLSDSVLINNLVPAIKISGKSITPSGSVAQNFTKPVTYTVTADDGSSQPYIVTVVQLASNKNITDFSFLKIDNKSLSADIMGAIHNDSITLLLPAGTQFDNLIPSITFTGVNISPSTKTVNNFSAPVMYTVTAEDGSTKSYVVVVSISQYVYFGSSDGYIYKVDGNSGDLKWKFKADFSGGTGVTLDNNSVYFGDRNQSFYSIDQNTGTIKWKQPVYGPLCTYPIVYNNKLYVARNGNYIGFYLHDLIALDAKTGNTDWIQQYYNVLGSPTVNGNLIYEGDLSNALLIFDAGTGKIIGSVENGITNQNTAVADGMMFNGGEQNSCFAADALTRAVKWRVLIHNVKPTGSVTVADNMVYVGESDYNLYAFDEFTGEVKWNSNANGFFSSAVVEKNTLFVNNANGSLYAFDALTGNLLWSFAGLGGNIDCTVANGIVYVGSSDGYFYAFNGTTGTMLWKYQASGSITAGACVKDSGGTIYYCGGSGGHN